MKFTIKIDEEAIVDIQKSTEWHGIQSNILGDRFKNQVKKQINSLKNNSLLFTIKYKNVRCRKIEKFPFLIHYTVDEDALIINVFAVLHTSRNPKIWNKRIKK